jgi:hypothetical protein
MAQDVPASVDTQIAAEQSRPVNLCEIGLDAGTLRFAATKQNLVFPTAGNTYTAKAMNFGNIHQTREGQIVKCQVKLDNVAQDMAGYNAAESFDGKSFVWKKIYRDAMGDASYYREMINGHMEGPCDLDYNWIVINAVRGKSLGRRMLLDYFQKECNHIFGDSECNRDGYADLTSLKATGTADAGSTAAYMIDAALTQADDYWNFGRIELVHNSITYYRDVKDFVAADDKVIFDVAFPFTISEGDTYTLYKGCSNTWNACQSNEAYGPSSDNKANFFGFIHIGDESV